MVTFRKNEKSSFSWFSGLAKCLICWPFLSFLLGNRYTWSSSPPIVILRYCTPTNSSKQQHGNPEFRKPPTKNSQEFDQHVRQQTTNIKKCHATLSKKNKSSSKKTRNTLVKQRRIDNICFHEIIHIGNYWQVIWSLFD